VTGNSNNITATAYKDSLYANQVGSVSFSSLSATGTGYGIIGLPSNFEDGRTIGSIKVKALGQ
jgi:hypothetical protein